MTTFDKKLLTLIGEHYNDNALYSQLTDLISERVLVGQIELANYCGVTRFSVQNWQRSIRHPLPAPAYRIGNGPAWWLDELEEWMSTNRNLLKPGSPAALALL